MSKQVELTNGGFAEVDDCDYGRISCWTWTRQDKGHTSYAVCGVTGQEMQRFIMNNPAGFEVDHVDGNGLNNKRLNLRLATRSQQGMNKRLQENNTSGYAGIHWYKSRQQWQVYINKESIRKFIGYFNNLEDAINARRQVAKELFGQFAPEGRTKESITKGL